MTEVTLFHALAFDFVDGTVTPSDAPGFGAALDRRKLERYAF